MLKSYSTQLLDSSKVHQWYIIYSYFLCCVPDVKLTINKMLAWAHGVSVRDVWRKRGRYNVEWVKLFGKEKFELGNYTKKTENHGNIFLCVFVLHIFVFMTFSSNEAHPAGGSAVWWGISVHVSQDVSLKSNADIMNMKARLDVLATVNSR